jgi:hypothetical protein
MSTLLGTLIWAGMQAVTGITSVITHGAGIIGSVGTWG